MFAYLLTHQLNSKFASLNRNTADTADTADTANTVNTVNTMPTIHTVNTTITLFTRKIIFLPSIKAYISMVQRFGDFSQNLVFTLD